ncbi:uncharacterized protein LOC126484280 [Schistocerca serialis cubense]|uniref:uncharacterized protein LOC126484280 n=1 Tax=Schistocerca serialis cubense TaxID=2023355 RepID=UPI00214E986F|nr:uncharacterized protein LOC126484280 [Schistocerca serialis cubense]
MSTGVLAGNQRPSVVGPTLQPHAHQKEAGGRRRSQRPYSRQDWRIAQYIKGGRRGSATVDSERPQQKSRRAEQQQTAAGNAGADQSDDMRLTTVFLLVALVMAACLTQMAYGNHEKSGGGGGGHDHGKGHSDGDGHGHDGR